MPVRFLISSRVRGWNLHRRKNAVLFNHKLITIPEMIFSFFQMAILAAAMSVCSEKMAADQRVEANVHAKHDQERSGSKACVSEGLGISRQKHVKKERGAFEIVLTTTSLAAAFESRLVRRCVKKNGARHQPGSCMVSSRLALK
jgi:hypothetical protein